MQKIKSAPGIESLFALLRRGVLPLIALSCAAYTAHAATLSISANPVSVTSGAPSTINWSSSDATSCAASGAWSGVKAISGNQSVIAPSGLSIYVLNCSGPSGSASNSVVIGAGTPAPAVYALNVTLTGSGTVTSNPSGIACGATCSANYPSGAAVSLTAVPATGYTFSGWSGACSGSGACVAAMTGPRSVMASFTAAPPGSLSISGTFAHGAQVTLIGSGFGAKSPVAPLVWATFEPGQGAGGNDRNPTTKGRRASWDIFQSASMLSTALVPANSIQALRMDMARDIGWPPAAPADFADTFGAQISLAPADAGVMYMRGKIYKDWHITEICQLYGICSINDKMWRTWRSDGSSSNQVITNMYSNWHHYPLDDGRVTTENAGSVAPCGKWTNRPYPFRQWNTDEWWYRRSSSADVSDGALRFVMNNVVHAEMLACVNLTSADPIGSTDFGIYEDLTGVPNVSPRPVGWWTYFKDVYIDNTWSRVVVADNANYASAANTEIQIPVAWSNTGIVIEANRGAFASFSGKYVFVFNAQNQVVGSVQIP